MSESYLAVFSFRPVSFPMESDPEIVKAFFAGVAVTILLFGDVHSHSNFLDHKIRVDFTSATHRIIEEKTLKDWDH